MGDTSSATTYFIQKHSHNGSTAIALNSSINYLGSAIGAALGGALLSQGGISECFNLLCIHFCYVKSMYTIGKHL
ncbi:hypothetical protein ACWEX2_02470 [Staphylococcus xylosus]|uniref:MFS transporter n=1 Tax=Staphylococcus xylosus TaxID=1288 RepID=A0AAQ0M133_STAXY|nr:hypothetical protein [Staphylococcus xylosus]MCE7786543.1 hypothetical protein [Staphylococcus xylosus]MCM3517461.1 hypothetical protein [Staphylococcus xylosus]MCQ3815476.1 hypothetical protein [Staphylococcus xylosus]MCQ3818179.1 hypothetical protein [Staphylococcus xylosus]RIM63767.1 hypothetical protein BU122_12725 [Staphylococcus xylosus]